LTNRDGTQTEYTPGEHEFPDDHADHFFVKAHSDQASDAGPALGSVGHVEKMRKVAEARRRAAEEADELVREAEEAHYSAEDQKARAAGIKAGLTAPKPAAGIMGGPAVEGAARAISPGLKGLPDRDAAVGNQIDQPNPTADDNSTVLDAVDEDDDDSDDSDDSSDDDVKTPPASTDTDDAARAEAEAKAVDAGSTDTPTGRRPLPTPPRRR
jgi:hypothetical protein